MGLNFHFLRILILFGWIRLIFRGEASDAKLNTIDKLLISWVIYSVASYTLLYGSLGTLINRLGFAYNTIGLYFLFRFLIRDFDDINRVFRMLAIVILPLASLILIEYTTGRNLFSIFGGVHEITQIRYGRLRCQGPFAHPILAGTFGAISIPFSAALWFRGRDTRLLAVAGCIAGTFVTFASGSSGPLLTYLSVIAGLAMWRLRLHMRFVGWGVFSGLVLLDIVMKARIWWLIARVSALVGAGTGYYRAKLIDSAVKYFDEWWLIGTKSNTHWMPFAGHPEGSPNMVDCTNQYVSEGVNGGLLKLLLFVGIITVCFRELGRALRIMEDYPLAARMTVWSMGVALFSHAVTFIGVTYFDQMIVFWYVLLAMISTVSDLSRKIRDQEGNTAPELGDT